jgi:hypothetical protein
MSSEASTTVGASFVFGDGSRASRFSLHTISAASLPGMKKTTKQLTKKIQLQSETIRALRDDQNSLVIGGQRGSTVPRSWCESCETAC